MFSNFKAARLPLWAIVGAQLVLGSVHAQVLGQAAAPAPSIAPSGARADPADPKVQVPNALYASPLRAYQGFAEPQVAPWRYTNERVRQRGGWRAYAREAREPDTARPAAGDSQPAPAARPASGGHAGHPMK